jgi:cbb3-type cytochrome oxidase subunit 3
MEYPIRADPDAGWINEEELNMPDVYFWIGFFGAPLLLFVVTAIVFRPSARQQYHEAKHAIFADDDALQPLYLRSDQDKAGGYRR